MFGWSRLVNTTVALLLTVAVNPRLATAQPPEQTPPPQDPFADIANEAPARQQQNDATQSGWKSFFKDNFGFRKEIMSQFDVSAPDTNGASRQSVGFEVLKKFSTETSTIASFDFQGRLVRRDGYNPVWDDMEGATRQGWAFEYHNLYLDLYNILNPFWNDEQRGRNAGRFNFRIGRFYVPFGLNLQTDTHGTVLQLSNGENFGFERDWSTGFWGSLNKHLNYDVYYMAGSGYDLKYRGQSGLGAVRISLANKYSSEYGIEGGLSWMGGERISPESSERLNANNTGLANPYQPIETKRIGLDGRYRRAVPRGLLTVTNEISGGTDNSSSVFMQLHEAEYLHFSRRWGVASQFRRLHQDGAGTESSIIGEISWYFRNDAGNSNSHWIKLNVERQLEQFGKPTRTLVTLQYYFYR